MVDTREIIGRKYGPINYEVGAEKIKEFAIAITDFNPVYFKQTELKDGTKRVVAPPIFAVVYIQKVINMALNDPALSLDLPMLVHAEQEFDFIDVVYSGDVITTEGCILNFFEKRNLKFIIIETKSTRNGQLVNKGISTFVIRKR
jgi:hypothetical protein